MSLFCNVFRRLLTFKTFCALLLLYFLFLLTVNKPETKLESMYRSNVDYMSFANYGLTDTEYHERVVNMYYEKRKKWKTSNLGSILFLNNSREAYKNIELRRKRTFVVLIWKYWKWLANRHVNNFNERAGDPMSECSVKNCIFTGNDEELQSADAVVVHIMHGIIPDTNKRNTKQRWIFLSDESPVNSFSLARTRPELSHIAYVFNWSMTYRSDADVPVPYGRTIPLQKPILSGITQRSLSTLVPYWKNKRRDVVVAILISNCGVSMRMDYVHSLEEHLTVDVYGKCSQNNKESCPGHYKADCKLMSEYLFYLAFENSQCDEYLTEKSFYHAYSKGAIPVIMGPSVEFCEEFLPPDSFLHIDNYNSVRDLAYDIIKISQDDRLLLNYHRWRNDFAITNEHGFFGSKSYHLCRVCEALNYNDDKEKVYDENSLGLFLNQTSLCRNQTDNSRRYIYSIIQPD